MSPTAIFTIASSNFSAQVMALFQSVKQYHPELDCYFILADKTIPAIIKNQTMFSVVRAEDLEIPEFTQFAFKYSVVEFNTAIKPFAFGYLFNKEYPNVMFLDPDIFVFNRLDFILDLFNQYSVLLTPHIANADFASHTFVNHEFSFLRFGIFNLGFLAIRADENGLKLINWMKIRCHQNCYILKNESTYVDQKWGNFIPALFDNVYVIKHLGCNVAYWNLHERQIENFKVNKKSDLLFFHFSSFDFTDNQKITKNPVFEFNLNSMPGLKSVFDTYRNAIEPYVAQLKPVPDYEYGFFSDGTKISEYQRILYQYVAKAYPNPFLSGSKSYQTLSGRYNNILKFSTLISDYNAQTWLGTKKDVGYVKLAEYFFKQLHNLLGSYRFLALVNQAKNYFIYLSSNAFLLNNRKKKS